MRPLRVAVWGLGRHAINKILPAISSVSGLELYGVCSRNISNVSSCAELWNCKGWSAPTPMLLDPLVDIIYVATPIGLHHEHGRQVLNAKKHFWCEKPLTCRLEKTLELLELSRYNGLSVCEGHMYLHHPQFKKLSSYVNDGKLGSIMSIDCRFGIPMLEKAGFRSDPDLGGGALFDVGCYPISAIQALFPDTTVDISYSNILVPDGSAIDTAGQAIIALSNGTTAHLEWRTNCSYRNEINIWGEKGSVFSDKVFSKPPDHIPEYRLRNTQGVETTEYGEAADHFALMLQYFRSTVYDLKASEAERHRIAGRAEMLHQIWSSYRQ